MIPLLDHTTGKQVTREDAVRYDVVVAGVSDVEGALLFKTDEAYYEWGNSSRYAEELGRYQEKLNQLRGLNESGRSKHLAHRMSVQKDIQRHLGSLSRSMGLPVDSDDLLQEALQKPEIRELATDPLWLYQGEDFTLRKYLLWGDHPDFRAINFNNITSSVQLQFTWFGTLFAKIWYEGRKFVMVGGPAPYFNAPRLSDVNFDNVASSYIQAAVFL